jgi:hypothetical protein
MAGSISMGARREVLSAVAERYWSAGRVEKGRILDALCRTTGWHRKHAVRALRRRVVKRYHDPCTPYERALAHPMVAEAVKERLRAQYPTLDPVALLAEIRSAQEELGNPH